MLLFTLILIISTFAPRVLTFPAYNSLAGLSQRELEAILPTLEIRSLPQPPGPIQDTSAKLVNDAAHPWKPQAPADIRGPCPGLNTLASHGWIPRNGIATPSQIIIAVQEAFNMDWSIAVFLTYAAHLVDGNLITDLLSIGQKTSFTGPDPPPPASVGGFNTHAVFEGDTSMTRADFYFGNNHDFNETLFDEFTDFCNRFGDGKYNLTVTAEYRWQRIQDSIATNPTFSYINLRFLTGYAESVFPINFFIDGRLNTSELDLDVARGFFQSSRMPDGFYRTNGSKSIEGMIDVAAAHPFQPGKNVGKVNNFVVDPTSADFTSFCQLYENFINQTVKALYPNPTGAVLDALNTNLDFFFQGVTAFNPTRPEVCVQVFPYGEPNTSN